jgi:hypothetical protein
MFIVTVRQRKKEVFRISSRNNLNKNGMNFIQICLEGNMLILKMGNFIDQMISLPCSILNDFFSSEQLSQKSKYKFYKKSSFHIFDLLTDLKTPKDEWIQLANHYFQLINQHQTLQNPEAFLFFSHFLKEFTKFNKNSEKNAEANLDTFSKIVVTTGRIVGTEHDERYSVYNTQ